jgi:hypothetical protein
MDCKITTLKWTNVFFLARCQISQAYFESTQWYKSFALQEVVILHHYNQDHDGYLFNKFER